MRVQLAYTLTSWVIGIIVDVLQCHVSVYIILYMYMPKMIPLAMRQLRKGGSVVRGAPRPLPVLPTPPVSAVSLLIGMVNTLPMSCW